MVEINALDRLINDNIKRFVESKSSYQLNRTRKHKNEFRQVLRILKKRKLNDGTSAAQSPGNNQTPVPFVLFKLGQNKYGRKTTYKTLRCLLDSGASHSLIKARFVEALRGKNEIKDKAEWASAGGMVKVGSMLKLNFILPEFSESTTTLDTFSIYEGPDEYLGWDVVIGRDMLSRMGIDLNFSNHTMVWNEIVLPMKPYERESKKDLKDLTEDEINTMIAQTEEPEATKQLGKRMERILDAKYEAATALNAMQKKILRGFLTEYQDLFDGTLGRWKTTPASAELKPGAKPVYTRHYKVPHINEEAFKKELMRLVELGVLERVPDDEDSGYGSPAFIIPKADKTVRFVTDFRKVNATVNRKPYPIPRINDTLQSMEGFQWATTLDLSMGYWTIELDPTTKNMTTITTEFGKFRYNVLPMGFVISSDVFQSKIMELLGAIEGVRCYLDDVLCLTKGSFEEHIEQLRKCFDKFREAGLKCNINKCSFGLTEVKYLGFIITRNGIKADPKKVEAILKIEKPKTVTKMKSLIGMVQFYKNMFKRRSHILTPLIKASTQGKKNAIIKWDAEMDRAFIELKQAVAAETLLRFPDWNKPFTLHTDASDFQLGGVLSQDG